ncbi:hypothetical protein TVAG_396840 [Trichomonas vaginalis G3]|uniref:Surface antigen BspA-like n=1 Tax=Trichomonas vaginalis (strain ATCC PRA-98 / G3) TaxID=412133 RepID=A2DX72_TRIV3|nr:hypothetical protein TVAG_396840 [Trichomonas vaginalis G3]|eukprot:XP_001327177.1 hypothetical protein [Trichomonas vaginalis G3]
MIANLSIIYKDINESCYSDDGKTLTKVNDTSPYLRISAKCEAIQDKCFYHLSSLISFSFEENPNLTKIRFSSFCECKNLTIINLSSCNKLATKYYTAFEFCYKVSEILLPNGLHEIQSSAFEYNTLLTSITIPASVEKIDKNAFSSCYRLSNVIFKEGSNLISLEYGVFWRTNIASFQIPEKVAYVNGYSFSTSTLKNLTIHPKNTFLKIGDNNTVFSANRSVLFFIGSKPIETYEIPDCVTTLGDYLFYQCNYKSIEIPNSVTTIGNGCFYNSNLKTIAFPCSLITIGEDSFSETKLVSIIIPESVKRIERAAFIFCHDLINVTLLGHIDFLGNQVFDYCKNLELIIFPNSTMIINYALCPVYSSPKLTMSFTYKTFFSTNTITTNTKVSISYLKESDLIINKYLLIMNSNMTII